MIDNVAFIKAWHKAKCVGDVAEELNMTARGASMKATTLRRHGVGLKRFPRGKGRNSADYKALAKLLKSLDD